MIARPFPTIEYIQLWEGGLAPDDGLHVTQPQCRINFACTAR